MSINIKQFFNEDYITFASYDNQRKLNKIKLCGLSAAL